MIASTFRPEMSESCLHVIVMGALLHLVFRCCSAAACCARHWEVRSARSANMCRDLLVSFMGHGPWVLPQAELSQSDLIVIG